MSVGLYSGVSGLALGTGLYKDVSGLWGGASGLINGFGGSNPFSGASLYLNFLAGAPLDSRVTFTRGSNATLVDSTGKITYAPANLVLTSTFATLAGSAGSQYPSGTGWSNFFNTGGTRTYVASSAFEGSQAMDIAGVSAARNLIGFSFAAASNTTYVVSFFIESVSGVTGIVAYATGTLGTGGTTNSITAPTTTGRYSYTFTTGAGAGTVSLRFGIGCATNESGSIRISNTQLEPVTYQTTAGPYVATTTAAYYAPRFDYDPVTLAAKGLLIEEQRTNLLTYSEQFDNAAWSKSGSTISANATTAPDGTLTADKLQVANTTNAQKNVGQTVGAISTTYADTVYAKASELSWLVINQYDGSDRRTWFNLSNGTVGTTAAGTTATIEALPNGWYRCRAVRLMGTGSIQFILNAADADNSAVFVGTVGQGIFIWGAQREAGAFATSYIPTVASQVTRSADVATMTGTNFSSWYNQNEGTFVVSYDVGSTTATLPKTTAVVHDGTSSNRIWGYIGNTGTPIVLMTNGGATQATLIATSVSANAVNQMAFAYRDNDVALSSNGGAALTDTLATVPTVNQLGVGGFTPTAAYLNGHIRQIAYYNTRLTNATLQALTA